MTALADPPQQWNAENSNAASALTGAAAGYPAGGWLVLAEAPASKPWCGSEDRRFASDFQGRFWLGASALNRGSEMGDRIRQYIDQSMVVVGQHAADEFDQWLCRFVPDCESEIERLLCVAFMRLEDLNRIGRCYRFEVTGGINGLCRPRSFEDVRRWAWSARFDPYENRNHEVLTYCYPQVTFGPYRVDFLIGSLWSEPDETDKRENWIVVECDGHEFHDKTKEQAQRDKARDRFLVASGVKVMRFTGAEIWRDPTRCALEVLRAADPDTSWVTGAEE